MNQVGVALKDFGKCMLKMASNGLTEMRLDLEAIASCLTMLGGG